MLSHKVVAGLVKPSSKSWGGFNALQIAARRPPQLQAVIAMHFTDDRYNDDVHYMGGCLLTSQMLAWAAVMFAANAAPPDPRFVGEGWREMWLARMEKTPPYIEAWLSHQRKDAYWKHGSVREDYSAIDIPGYAVGGWADAYNNSILRLLAGLSGPRKGIIGPWSHNFPETGVPGPAISFLQESLRWWDRWLSLSKPDSSSTLTILGRQNHGLDGGEWGGAGLSRRTTRRSACRRWAIAGLHQRSFDQTCRNPEIPRSRPGAGL